MTKTNSYNTIYSDFLKENNLTEFSIGRITREDRERYLVTDGENEYEGEITGNLRFTASSRSDFPAVGDWVAMKVYGSDMAIIHKILPRKTVLERQSVSKFGEKQIISANVDVAFIVQSLDINFNINRLERYMTVCNSSGIEPVIILSKTDLVTRDESEEAVKKIRSRHPEIRYLLLNNFSPEDSAKIRAFMREGLTYCVVGSSGTGKSTLINNLLERNETRTQEISSSTNKGKHTTERRELFQLENGAIIIDTPGMRELGVTESDEGIKNTFRDIHELALKCKFPDCTHTGEKGCAVIEALSQGTIDINSLENYRRLLREQVHFSESIAERRKKDREFGKMVRKILDEKKKMK